MQNMGQWLQNFYDTTEPVPPDFLADRESPPAPKRRNPRLGSRTTG